VNNFNKKSVYIIIPVHNRQQITLNCLARLAENGDQELYHVVVVDDGSTDGTSQAIESLYPDVIILQGDGNLWWTGAIKKGMEYAYDQGAEYFIWLNDDTLPSEGAISQLVDGCLANPDYILGGQSYQSSDFQIPTYGGMSKRIILRELSVSASDGEYQACDFLSGNLVCIPRLVVDAIGYPPADLVPHYHGDAVYTYKAKKLGYKLLIMGSAKAVSEINLGDSSWLRSNTPIGVRWKSLTSPKSVFYYRSYWHFCLAFWGIWVFWHTKLLHRSAISSRSRPTRWSSMPRAVLSASSSGRPTSTAS